MKNDKIDQYEQEVEDAVNTLLKEMNYGPIKYKGQVEERSKFLFRAGANWQKQRSTYNGDAILFGEWISEQEKRGSLALISGEWNHIFKRLTTEQLYKLFKTNH